jgi:UDP-N-acetylglucosamine 2-epimerase (non-hydrolysing)
VEAGLRSFDRGMPEEINRVVTDAIADLLLVTEESGVQNLRREGVPESRIVMVGNLMIDSLYRNLERARRESGVAAALGIEEGARYGVVTLHRPANVDEPGHLEELLDTLRVIAATQPLYFPAHPRTRARLRDVEALAAAGIHFLDPLGYVDFLALMARASIVLTDSGGIQEETTALGIPCLTLRENTERPITVLEGTNLLAGVHRETILAAWEKMRLEPKKGRVPRYWDGHAAERCRDALRSFLGMN